MTDFRAIADSWAERRALRETMTQPTERHWNLFLRWLQAICVPLIVAGVIVLVKYSVEGHNAFVENKADHVLLFGELKRVRIGVNQLREMHNLSPIDLTDADTPDPYKRATP